MLFLGCEYFDVMNLHWDLSLSDLSHNVPVLLYFKGGVGDWKNWFTEAMNEDYDKEFKKRMSEYKTVYKYTLEQM